MFIQPALNNFRCVLKVLSQRLFRQIEQFNFDVLAEVSFIHQRFHTAPQRFDGLKVVMVHYRIQLTTDLVIKLRNMMVNQVFI
ncbi:hypothetical protein D3C80_1021360 [compost metagenome]